MLKRLFQKTQFEQGPAAEVHVPHYVREMLLPEESVLAGLSFPQVFYAVITNKRIIIFVGTTVKSIPWRMVRSWSTYQDDEDEYRLCIQLRDGKDPVVVDRLSHENLIKLDRIVAECVL